MSIIALFSCGHDEQVPYAQDDMVILSICERSWNKKHAVEERPCRNKSFGGLTDRQLLLLFFAVSALFLIPHSSVHFYFFHN